LSDKFVDLWREKGSKHHFTAKIKGTIRPKGRLKERLDLAIKRIELQIRRLDNAFERFSKRDAAIFKRIVKSYSAQNTLRANILANELAELRKVEKMLMQAKLALEGISLRLKTVSDFGDIITLLAPAANVLKNIESGMANVFPEANRELEDIRKLLTEIVSSSSQTTELPINVEAANEDAEKILKEAALAAEQRIKKELPDVTTEVSVKEKVGLKT